MARLLAGPSATARGLWQVSVGGIRDHNNPSDPPSPALHCFYLSVTQPDPTCSLKPSSCRLKLGIFKNVCLNLTGPIFENDPDGMDGSAGPEPGDRNQFEASFTLELTNVWIYFTGPSILKPLGKRSLKVDIKMHF